MKVVTRQRSKAARATAPAREAGGDFESLAADTTLGPKWWKEKAYEEGIAAFALDGLNKTQIIDMVRKWVAPADAPAVPDVTAPMAAQKPPRPEVPTLKNLPQWPAAPAAR